MMSGTHYLFYTVGNRDLRIDGQVPPQSQFRSVCEQFLASVRDDPTAADRLEAPQLENCLRYLARRVERLSRVYLIATADNPDPAFRETETAPAAALLALRLERHKNDPDYRELLGQAATKTLTLRGQNPAEYGGVYRWFRANLPQLAPGTVWVHPVSGTPAMTMGLVLAAAGRWGEEVRLLFQTPNTPVEEDPLTLEILRENLRRRLLDRLERLDFAGAAALAGPGAPVPDGVRPLVEAGLERTRFNFHAADLGLEAALREITDPAAREAVRRLRVALEPLLTQPKSAADSRPFLVELLFNARACWRAGREVDFLGRVYRLHEGLARYLLEQLGFPTDEGGDRREKTRSEFWARAGELGLTEHLPADPAVQVGGSVNRPAMLAVLRALCNRSPAGLDVETAQKFVPWLEGVLGELATLRNKTILGHGFTPVSRGEVERLVREQTGLAVEAWLETMARSLDPAAWDPFEATAGVVRRLLPG